jgi:hypothetical protein
MNRDRTQKAMLAAVISSEIAAFLGEVHKMRDEDETKEQLIADAKPRQSLARGEMMKDQRKTKEQLVKELAELRQRDER